MRQLFFALTLILTLVGTDVAAVRPAAASPRARLSDDLITEAVNAHNDLRRRVAQAESQRLGDTVFIPDVAWDAHLAAVAQDWANQQAARIQQGYAPQHRPSYNPYGENMYWASASPDLPDLSPTAAVEAWASEQQYYDYDSTTCAAPEGKSCGHYTQLVWTETIDVGCGQAVWTGADGLNHVFWVCNYSPAGNITYNGQTLRPYSVAAEGRRPGQVCGDYPWPMGLGYGASGNDVRELQLRLNTAGAHLVVDRIFGRLTEQALQRFQIYQRIPASGVVDAPTQSALNRFCPKVIKLGKIHP